MLLNVTREKDARAMLVPEHLAALAGQLASASALRRLGAAGALRNCLMSAQVRPRVQHLHACVWGGRGGGVGALGIGPRDGCGAGVKYS